MVRGGRYGLRIQHRNTQFDRGTINKTSIGVILQTTQYLVRKFVIWSVANFWKEGKYC